MIWVLRSVHRHLFFCAADSSHSFIFSLDNFISLEIDFAEIARKFPKSYVVSKHHLTVECSQISKSKFSRLGSKLNHSIGHLICENFQSELIRRDV